jgi:hypothetical protein
MLEMWKEYRAGQPDGCGESALARGQQSKSLAESVIHHSGDVIHHSGDSAFADHALTSL